jgi:DNA polymerase-3 subunit epsilon
LVYFDLETTGTTVGTDRIVEFAAIKVWPDGTRKQYVWRINPEMPIPPEASKIHGITDEDVRDQPTFKTLMPELREIFSGSDIGGFNVARFDVPMLQSEVARAGATFDVLQRHIVDSMTIFHMQEPRNLAAAYRHYCNKVLENAHSALADVAATVEILEAQIERYADLPADVEQIAAFTGMSDEKYADSGRWFIAKDGGLVFAKGKHKGKTLADIAKSVPDYLEWMCGSLGLPPDTHKYIHQAMSLAKAKHA